MRKERETGKKRYPDQTPDHYTKTGNPSSTMFYDFYKYFDKLGLGSTVTSRPPLLFVTGIYTGDSSVLLI